MNYNKKTTSTGTGFVFALLAFAPVLADDTELLLVNPGPVQQPKPNVMFILDTSGSMISDVSTVEPYNAAQTYGGSCATDAMYWTEVDLVPTCSDSNQQWVYKSAFKCDYAIQQIQGLGSFTNTMVQFRDTDDVIDTDTSDDSWTSIRPGSYDEPVECRLDSGVHGDGTTGEVYAAAGSGTDWTSDAAQEISWGSAPRNRSYTVYDGNYLNWRNSPSTVVLTRMEIVKNVTRAVVSSLRDMNVGIMRFNDTSGGSVLSAMQDLESNRSSLLTAIDSLEPGGATPLSETLYENARYWSGLSLDLGEDAITDPGAVLTGMSGTIYRQPALGSCSKNYNVLITDGAPTNDEDGLVKAPTLPGWNATLGRSGCTDTIQGACLDDVAEYLSKVDVAAGLGGVQSVRTHVIGFNIDLDLLAETASASGGKYLLADEIESLTTAILQIVGEINEKSLSFAAPAVTVSTFNRTQNLNDLYLSVFTARNKTHWPGNLKKYRIEDGDIVDANGNSAVNPSTGFFFDDARSLWTTGVNDGNNVLLGGAARRLPDPASRNLYTKKSSDKRLYVSNNAISTTNSGNFVAADFGLTGAAGEPTVDQMIEWMRGADLRDEDGDPATTVRYAMGDPLHARPATIVYGGSASNPEVVVFTATNDGYVHAIDGSTGEELWAFVPVDLLPNMARLYEDPDAAFKQYGMDGNITPVIKDVDNDGVIEPNDGDFAIILMGMRRGGMSYYALDVTRKTAPELMWKKTLADGGQSWSTPVVTRMDIDEGGINGDKAVVVIGGGYDPVHDTAEHPSSPDAQAAGLHILDLQSGQELWRAGNPDSGADQKFDEMNRAFPTEIRVVDLNGDRFADRMYAVDISGQVWRFDIIAGEDPNDLVNGGVIAQLGAEGLSVTPTAADTRRYYNAPDLSIFKDPVTGQRYVSIAVGSGYRAHPFDTSAADRFYALRDPAVFNALPQTSYDSYDIITEADLVEVSSTVKNVIGASARGWKFSLPANEKVLAESVTFNNEIFFVSFDPTSVGAADCGVGQGANFLYRISVVNGDPVVNNLDTIVPGQEDEARRTRLAQGGIAPNPSVLFPSPTDPANCTGAACNPPPIMCVGVECSQLLFRNVPVRTLWRQDGVE